MIDLQYYTKDNLPVTLIENIIAHNFLLIDIILIIACLILIAKLSKQQWNWKVFAIVCIPSILSGFIIGAINYYIDNQIPGWIVLPWNTLGIIGYWYIEDWLFYCFTTIFFYGLYRYYHKSLRNDFRYSEVIKNLYFYFLLTTSILMFCFTGICGKLETVFYAVPALFLMKLSWKHINIRKMLIFVVSLVLFEMLWDWFAVSWIYNYKSWAPGWIYLIYDSNYIATCSKVFLDPQKSPWAWIFNNPIEITPWYGISGITFLYTAITTIDIMVKNENK
jgi:hypothetical protein